MHAEINFPENLVLQHAVTACTETSIKKNFQKVKPCNFLALYFEKYITISVQTKCHSLRLILALFFISLLGTSQAAVVLIVDITDPSAVTITATTNFSAINDSTSQDGNGIVLKGLFSSGSGSGSFTSGDLAAPGGVAYNFSANGFNSTVTDLDLNLFSQDKSNTQSFVDSAAAFTGSLTINLDSEDLSGVGSSGDVLVGDGEPGGGSGLVIGTYQIIPEPSMVSLLIMGLGTLCIVRRRRA